MTYRVRPGRAGAGPARVIYVLHGNGGTYAEWSRDSAIVRLAPAEWTLVMPEGGSSYWMNSASVAQDRYEDFVTRDLVAEAERGVDGPVDRAIVGNSMGGFAALVLGMKHLGLYGFVGALSPPVDYPERAFSLKRVGQSMAIRAIFGPEGSATRKANDPFVLAAHADSARLPYIFLSVGDQEPLLGPAKRFDAVLNARHVKHEFHVEPGGHNWGQWNQALPVLVGSRVER